MTHRSSCSWFESIARAATTRQSALRSKHQFGLWFLASNACSLGKKILSSGPPACWQVAALQGPIARRKLVEQIQHGRVNYLRGNGTHTAACKVAALRSRTGPTISDDFIGGGRRQLWR